MAHRSRHTLAAACASAGAAVLFCAAGASGTTAATPPAFVVGPLPQATGVQYASGVTRNEDVEPGVGVAGDGTFWVGSDIDVNTSGDPRAAGAISGVDVWKSTDGGRSYQWVAAPLNASSSTPALGGEDSDLAAAPEPNSSGHYNVYAVSLYVAASNLAISQDDGATWTTMSVGGIPAQDRPWLSADGPCVFYLTYHQLPLFAPVVNRYDVCDPTDVGMGIALNPVQATPIFLSNSAPGLTNDFNKPVVDVSKTSPYRHTMYVPMEACDLQSPSDFANNVIGTAEQVPTCPQGVPTQTEVAVSSDGGQTFSDYVVAVGVNNEQEVWGPTVAVDSAGTVYMAWSDNHDTWFSRSKDQGKTWSPAVKLPLPAGTEVYPTLAAGGPGDVDLAFYGTQRRGDSNDSTAAGMGKTGDPAAAQWHLYWGRSTDGGGSFSTWQIGGVNHTGMLCTFGGGCPGRPAGNRNLYDDFGMAISPTTGLASIAFDADESLRSTPDAAAVDPFTAFASELPSQAAATSPTTVTPAPGGSGGTAGGVKGLPNTAPAGDLGSGAMRLLGAGMLAAAVQSVRRRRRARAAARD